MSDGPDFDREQAKARRGQAREWANVKHPLSWVDEMFLPLLDDGDALEAALDAADTREAQLRDENERLRDRIDLIAGWAERDRLPLNLAEICRTALTVGVDGDDIPSDSVGGL